RFLPLVAATEATHPLCQLRTRALRHSRCSGAQGDTHAPGPDEAELRSDRCRGVLPAVCHMYQRRRPERLTDRVSAVSQWLTSPHLRTDERDAGGSRVGSNLLALTNGRIQFRASHDAAV